MDFVTIDFETASSAPNSPCEIGLTFVRNGIIQGTYSKLIRPPGNRYDYWNIKVHGIKPEETQYQPSFGDIWPELQPMLEGQFIVAHNAAFDLSVLRNTLSFYKLSVPPLLYACSVQIARKVWVGLQKYNLKSLCDLHGIHLNHHRAEADSLATAQLCIKAFEQADIASVNDIRTKLGTHVWQMQAHGNVRLGLKKRKPSHVKNEHVAALVSKLNPASMFYQKKVVITGELSTMKRLEALQEILDIGGFPEERVTPETDFLIVGRNEHRQTGVNLMSSKQRIALEFITKGSNIRFISEPEFIHQLQAL